MRMTREYEICLNLYNFLKTEPRRCGDLAELVGTTRNHLHGLTRKLRIAGLVKIEKGAKGGILLPERAVTALDVASAIGITPKLDRSDSSYGSISNMVITRVLECLSETVIYRPPNV